MELPNLDTLKQQWDVIMEAPHVAIAVIVVASVLSWWLRTEILKGTISQERARAEQEKARAGVAEERVRLAQEQAKIAQDARDAAEANVSQIESDVKSGASKETIIRGLGRVSKELESAKEAGRKIIAITDEGVGITSSVTHVKDNRRIR